MEKNSADIDANEFDVVSVIPLNEKLYVIAKPKNVRSFVSPENSFVFCTQNEVTTVVKDEKIIAEVFNKYKSVAQIH